jgi:hypothetical protein
MDFRNINQNANRQAIERQLETMIRPDNYGFEDPAKQWNLTEILREPSHLGLRARQLIDGESTAGHKLLSGPMQGADGRALEFRIQVVSRQACSEAADGTSINGTDIQYTNAAKKHTTDATIYPEWDEPPIPGDVVLIKQSHKDVDPITRAAMTPERRNAMLAQGISHINYARKTVDNDGCIWCNSKEAPQILGKNGVRLVFPALRRRDPALDNKKATQRTRTNWYFQETPPTQKTTGSSVARPRGRPAKTEELNYGQSSGTA